MGPQSASRAPEHTPLPLGEAYRLIDRLIPDSLHLQLLWLLLALAFVLRMLWLAWPDEALIFDERYYVNAARVIAGVAPDADIYQDRELGLDPNTEHPPLAKVMVAGSIRLLGDTPLGWRLPSVVAGTASILLMYAVARRLGAHPVMGLVAAGLLAFDNLVFVHSRIFTLDIFQLAFMLLGLNWYLGGRSSLGGVGFALAALCKIGGFFGLGAVAAYELLLLVRSGQPWRIGIRVAARRLALAGATSALVFLVGLGIMDRLWVGYAQPFEHVQRIVTYGAALRRPEGPTGVESYPWQWLLNETQMPYLKAERQLISGEQAAESKPFVLFLGAMNPVILLLLPFGLAFAVYSWWRRAPYSNVASLAIAWLACTYLPFFAATLFGQRVAYLFYFLPTLPAVALAGSAFLVGAGLPRIIMGVSLGAVLLGFVAYFPFKAIP